MIAPLSNFHAMPSDMAKEQHQALLEQLFNKNQLIPRIRREFIECTEVDFKGWIDAAGLPEKLGFDLLTQMALHKRCNLPTLVGVLRHHCDEAQEVVDLIQKAAEADLVDWDPSTKMFVVIFTLSSETQEELDKYQYPLPMVIKPQPVTHNRENGYLLSKGSVILRDNHHDNDVCLDHLNRMNRIKFSIDYDVAHMVRNQWRNLDKPKEGESKDDFTKRVKAFEKYDRTAKDVMTHLLQFGNEFYLTHKYDKRGRVYCQGYHVNYQGAPWNKAVIELADKELVL